MCSMNRYPKLEKRKFGVVSLYGHARPSQSERKEKIPFLTRWKEWEKREKVAFYTTAGSNNNNNARANTHVRHVR